VRSLAANILRLVGHRSFPDDTGDGFEIGRDETRPSTSC
jgi:hypothetical protein